MRLLKLLNRNSRGEISVVLTLLSLVLMIAGVATGTYLAQRETDTRSLAYVESDCDSHQGFKEWGEDCDCGKMQPDGELVKVAVCYDGTRLPNAPTGNKCSSGTCGDSPPPSTNQCANENGRCIGNPIECNTAENDLISVEGCDLCCKPKSQSPPSGGGDGPGGACDTGQSGVDNKGCNIDQDPNSEDPGCRPWERCDNGVCIDTTNGGNNPASSDSCGGGGDGDTDGYFHLEGDVNPKDDQDFGKGCNINVKFVSDGCDGDIVLRKNGAHIAGPNAWNSGGGPFTFDDKWTDSPYAIKSSVSFTGEIVNGPRDCAGTTSDITCKMNNDCSGTCGGSSPEPEPTQNPNPTSPNPSSQPTNSVIPTPSSIPVTTIRPTVTSSPSTIPTTIQNTPTPYPTTINPNLISTKAEFDQALTSIFNRSVSDEISATEKSAFIHWVSTSQLARSMLPTIKITYCDPNIPADQPGSCLLDY